MSLNTVQLYMYGLLNNLALPTTPATNLQAFIAPPAVNANAAAQCQAFVWGSDGHAHRETMGMRGQLLNGSFRQAVHEVDVWLEWYQDLSTSPNINSVMPAIVDTVRITVERSPYQRPNTLDTLTGYVSDIYDIGDTNKWVYGPWRAVAPQSTLVACSARITFTVKEWYLM